MTHLIPTIRIWVCTSMALMGSLFFLGSSAFGKTVNVQLTAVETEVVIDGKGTTFKAWTYNGQMPGPVVRVTQGDTIHPTPDISGAAPHVRS